LLGSDDAHNPQRFDFDLISGHFAQPPPLSRQSCSASNVELMLRDPAWFVSYAWRDDTSPAGLMGEQRVDQACEAARELCVVIWDVKIGYLDKIIGGRPIPFRS
jgi:hypothetical protein